MENTQLLLNNQVCFPIYTASRLITKAYAPLLKRLDITYPQYLVLMVLWEDNGISINKISEKLLLQSNTLSPLLQRMEKMELLKRNRSDQDERSVQIVLTPKGEALEAEAADIPEKLLDVLRTEKIALEEIIQLKNTLNQWIDVLARK